RLLPGVQTGNLKGGVKYWDGQFDDARLALTLARTAAANGALVVNYCRATDLLHHHGRLTGVQWQDADPARAANTADDAAATGTVRARVVINATGVWVDALRRQDA